MVVVREIIGEKYKDFDLVSLTEKTGISHYNINLKSYEEESSYFAKLRNERGFHNEYTIAFDGSGDCEAAAAECVRDLLADHFNCEDVGHFLIEGDCQFDVHTACHAWLRIWMRPGDLLIIPAGLYNQLQQVPSEESEALAVTPSQKPRRPFKLIICYAGQSGCEAADSSSEQSDTTSRVESISRHNFEEKTSEKFELIHNNYLQMMEFRNSSV